MNKSFSLRGSINFLAIVLVVMGVFTISLNQYLTNEVKQTNAQAVQLQELANHAHEMQFHVVQVQQYLTDVSATADRGGFDEAATHFNAANALLDKLAQALPQYSNEFNHVRGKLNTFNEVGKTMAET